MSSTGAFGGRQAISLPLSDNEIAMLQKSPSSKGQTIRREGPVTEQLEVSRGA